MDQVFEQPPPLDSVAYYQIDRLRPVHLVLAVPAFEVVSGQDQDMLIGQVLGGIHLPDHGFAEFEAFAID
jgi:hypothetical protein